MIQIVFTDNGKVHTVTFSGEDNHLWAEHLCQKLKDLCIDYELSDLSCVVYQV